MNKYLEQLVLLSKIDQEIDSYEPKIDSINRTLKDAELKIGKINTDLEKIDEEIKDIENQKYKIMLIFLSFRQKLKSFLKKWCSKNRKRS